MKKLRIGIVGCGGMAGAHAWYYAQVPGIELASCYDIIPHRGIDYAAKHNVPHVASSLAELLDRVQAVSVVTSDPGHAVSTLRALDAGKHVFCEKPLTVTMGEARQVARGFARASRKGLIGMTNFSHRGSHFRAAQRMIARGDIGEVRYVHGYYLQGWLIGPVEKMGPGAIWRIQRGKSLGTLGDLGCHLLDFVTGIVGAARSVQCTLRTHPKIGRDARPRTLHEGLPLDVNDSALIDLDFANGAHGVCHTTRWAAGRRNDVLLEIHGAEGGISLGHTKPEEPFLRICRGKSLKSHEWKDVPVAPFVSNWHSFARAVRTGRQPQPDLLRGAEIQSLLDACIRSDAAGGVAAKPVSWR